MRRLALFLLALAAVPAPASAYTAAAVAGTWFGTGQPEDRSEMYIDHFLPNGVFTARHRWCRQGKALDHAQNGRWSLKGDILTIHIETEAGVRVERDDVYRIVRLDAKRQTSVYLPANFTYNDHRVDEKFPMPPCDLTS
jgi:hypothetical protein